MNPKGTTRGYVFQRQVYRFVKRDWGWGLCMWLKAHSESQVLRCNGEHWCNSVSQLRREFHAWQNLKVINNNHKPRAFAVTSKRPQQNHYSEMLYCTWQLVLSARVFWTPVPSFKNFFHFHVSAKHTTQNRIQRKQPHVSCQPFLQTQQWLRPLLQHNKCCPAIFPRTVMYSFKEDICKRAFLPLHGPGLACTLQLPSLFCSGFRLSKGWFR